MKKILTIPPIFKGIGQAEPLLPSYIFKEARVEVKQTEYILAKLILWLLRGFTRVRLRALNITSHAIHKKFLPQEIVDDIYTREACTYEWKHHYTTNFRDTWWRRIAAFVIVSAVQEKKLNKVKFLDIGTGVGLSMEEMFRVFAERDLPAEGIGLDYNEAMLREARQVTLPRMAREHLIDGKDRSVTFVRGDARNLRGIKSREPSITSFRDEEFDFITLICGAGGIYLPLEAFIGELALLKKGGQLIVIDIHRPFFNMPEHWPRFTNLINQDLVQVLGWRDITLPLILRDLWGWLDPTPLFYLLPLTVDKTSLTGFKAKRFEVVTEKWWFGLPVMTTARLVLEKESLSETEITQRARLQQELFSAIF